MSTEQMRSEFEAYLKSRYLDGRGHFDTWQERFVYTHSHIQAMWEGWQAAWKSSRAALVVELPEKFEVEMGAYGTAEVISVTEVKATIRAAGITVRDE